MLMRFDDTHATSTDDQQNARDHHHRRLVTAYQREDETTTKGRAASVRGAGCTVKAAQAGSPAAFTYATGVITVTVTAVSPDAKGKVLSATAIVNLGDYIDMRFENADSHERISANIVKSISVGGIYHVRAMVRTGSGSNGYAFDPNVTWTVAYADRGGKPAGADGKTAETAQSLVAADDLDSLKNAAKTGGTESAYVVGSDHSLYLYISPSDKDFQRIRVTALSKEYKSGEEPAQAHFDVVRSVRGTIRVDTDKQKNISSLTLSCGDEVSFYGFLNSEEDDNLDWDLTGAKSDDTYILAEGDEGKPLSVRGAEKTTLHIGTDESASSLTVRVKDPYYSTVKTLNIRISHYTRAYIVNESSRAFTGNTTSLSRNGRVVLKAKLDSLVDDPKNTNALSPDNKNNLDGKISWTISGNREHLRTGRHAGNRHSRHWCEREGGPIYGHTFLREGSADEAGSSDRLHELFGRYRHPGRQ